MLEDTKFATAEELCPFKNEALEILKIISKARKSVGNNN